MEAMLHGVTRTTGGGGGAAAASQVDALTLKLQEIGFDDDVAADAEAADMMDDDDTMTTTRVGTAIKVRTLTGRELVVDIDPADTVARIKRRVEEMEGIPPEQQRLILGGRQLADGKTARECNVGAGCVIHLVLALRGGG